MRSLGSMTIDAMRHDICTLRRCYTAVPPSCLHAAVAWPQHTKLKASRGFLYRGRGFLYEDKVPS